MLDLDVGKNDTLWVMESRQSAQPSLEPRVRICGLLGRPEEPFSGGKVHGAARRAQLDPPL